MLENLNGCSNLTKYELLGAESIHLYDLVYELDMQLLVNSIRKM